MKKYKKIFNIVWIVGFVLAVLVVFMGFINALSIQHKDGGVWTLYEYESIYRIMFVDRSPVFRNQFILIVAFSFAILAIAIFIVLTVLNNINIIHKRLNLGLTIGAMGLLTVSGIIMIVMCPIICTPELYSAYYKVTLSAGTAAWSSLCWVSTVCLGATIFINKKLLKGLY